MAYKRCNSDQLVNDQLGLSRLQTRSDAFGRGRCEFDSEVHLFRLDINIDYELEFICSNLLPNELSISSNPSACLFT